MRRENTVMFSEAPVLVVEDTFCFCVVVAGIVVCWNGVDTNILSTT